MIPLRHPDGDPTHRCHPQKSVAAFIAAMQGSRDSLLSEAWGSRERAKRRQSTAESRGRELRAQSTSRQSRTKGQSREPRDSIQIALRSPPQPRSAPNPQTRDIAAMLPLSPGSLGRPGPGERNTFCHFSILGSKIYLGHIARGSDVDSRSIITSPVGKQHSAALSRAYQPTTSSSWLWSSL